MLAALNITGLVRDQTTGPALVASELLMDLGFRSATTADGPRSISFWLVLSIINPLPFPHKVDMPQRISSSARRAH